MECISIHSQRIDFFSSTQGIDIAQHTSKNIQKVSDREPRRPDAASRGVNGTGCSATVALQSHATGIVMHFFFF